MPRFFTIAGAMRDLGPAPPLLAQREGGGKKERFLLLPIWEKGPYANRELNCGKELKRLKRVRPVSNRCPTV
jgi:hypothetical protein